MSDEPKTDALELARRQIELGTDECYCGMALAAEVIRLSELVNPPPFKTPVRVKEIQWDGDYIVGPNGQALDLEDICDYINAQAELHARFGTKNEETK